MTAAGDGPPVHRMVFRHTGQRDFQVTESSLDQAATREWAFRLRSHIRVVHSDRPPTSLAYIRHDAWAAVLYRWSSLGDDRGDVCHVLVSERSLLSAEVALQLCNWDQWKPAYWAGHLQPYRRDEIQRALHPSGDLRQEAEEQREELVEVVANMLRPPAGPVSIVADKTVTQLLRRAGLLWGVRGAVEALFELPGQRPFTFSTFEERSDESARHLPTVIFIPPGLGRAASFRARREVAIPLQGGTQSTEDEYVKAATTLVDCFFTNGSASDVREWLAENSVLEPNSLNERVAALVRAVKSRQQVRAGSGSSVSDSRPKVDDRAKADDDTEPMPRVTADANGSVTAGVKGSDTAAASATEAEIESKPDIFAVVVRLWFALIEKIRDLFRRAPELAPDDRRIRDLLSRLEQPAEVESALAEIGEIGQRTDSDKEYVHKQLVERCFYEESLRVALSPAEMPGAFADLIQFGITSADDRLLIMRLRKMLPVGASRLVTAALVIYAYKIYAYKANEGNLLDRPRRWRAWLGAWLERWEVRADYRREKRTLQDRGASQGGARYILAVLLVLALVFTVTMVAAGKLRVPGLSGTKPPTTSTGQSASVTGRPPAEPRLDQLIRAIGPYQVASSTRRVTVTVTGLQPPPDSPPGPPWRLSAEVTITPVVDFAKLELSSLRTDRATSTIYMPHLSVQLEVLNIAESSFRYADRNDRDVAWVPANNDLPGLRDQFAAQAKADAGQDVALSARQTAENMLRDVLKPLNYDVQFS